MYCKDYNEKSHHCRRIVASKGGHDHLLPKFEHIFVAVITFFLLSSVQILLIPACCLLSVLSDDM